MLGSTASLAADDLCIRCRVRRSPYALNPEFDEEREMNCTMRNWKATTTTPSAEPSSGGMFASGGGGASSSIIASGVSHLAHQRSTSAGAGAGGSDASGGGNCNDSGTDMSATTLNLLVGDGEAHHHGPEILLSPVHLPPGSHDGRSYSNLRIRRGGRNDPTTPTRQRLPPPGSGNRQDSGGGGYGGRVFNNSDRNDTSTSRGRSVSRGSRNGSNVGLPVVGGNRSLSRSRGSSRLRGGSVLANAAFDVSVVDASSARPDNEVAGAAATATATAGDATSAALDCSIDSTTTATTLLQAWKIPTSDIIVVDVGLSEDRTDGKENEESENSAARASRSRSVSPMSPRLINQINITTISSGYFRISFNSQNAHDVMLAFLHGSLPSERVTRRLVQSRASLVRDPEAMLHTSASCCMDSNETFDMENFTAREMKHRVKRETLLEKLRRRVTHIANQCGELSLTLSDSLCGQDLGADSPAAYSTKGNGTAVSTPHHASPYDDEQELAEEPKISFEQGGTPERDQNGNSTPIDVVAEISGGLALDSEFKPKFMQDVSAELLLSQNGPHHDPPTSVGTSGSDDEHHGSAGSATGARLQTVDI